MSTLKSHTKNELARISAKINHLKRKYPSYVDQQNQVTQNNSDRLSQNLYEQHSYLYQKNMQRRPSSGMRNYNDTNLIHNGQKTQALMTPRMNQRDFHSSDKHKNKQNLMPEMIGLPRQKPLDQYKQQLKHLKRQILSSLDFDNFQQKRNNLFDDNEKSSIKKKPISNNYTDKSDKKLKLNFNSKQNNEINSNQPLIVSSRNQFYDSNQNHINLNNQISFSNQNQFFISTNKNSQFQSCQLKNLIEKLYTQFFKYKQQNFSKMEKIQSQIKTLKENQQQTDVKIDKIYQKPTEAKQFSFEMKMMQMQNHTINKLSKQIYNQIQKSKEEIRSIKQILNAQKFNQKQSKQTSNVEQTVSKIYKEIFNLKNQIQLIEEKIQKDSYIQKSLKNLLIQQKNKSEQFSREQIQTSVTKNILNNKFYLQQISDKILQISQQKLGQIVNFKLQNENLKTFEKYCKEHFYFQILQDVTEMNSKFLTELSDQISTNKSFTNKNIQKTQKQINSISRILKQSETKLVSYGILISGVEQTVKDLLQSNKQKQRSKELNLITLESVEKTINQSIQKKLNQFINEIQKIQVNKLQEVKTKNSNAQSYQTLNNNDQKNSDMQMSKFSIYSQQPLIIQPSIQMKKQNESDLKESHFIKTENKNHEKHPLQQQETQNKKSFVILDQLLKNSLVFQAFNEKNY